MTPYLLPEGNVQIAFSGGRTSAFMLHHILEANGDLPDRVEVTFQNTGREMPQTLDFVAEVGQRWGVMVTWLEYRAEKPFFEIVGHQGASRKGEPFEALIRKRKYLPNQQSRFCTVEMKVRTAKRYLRSLGWDYWTNCVGIRADEAHRSTNPPKDRWTVWRPLVDAGVSKRDVSEFWERQAFDLDLPNVNGNCWLGNCDGCFLKSEANIAAFMREYPDRAAWWEDMEDLASTLTSGSAATFSKRYSRPEMRKTIEKQGDWIFDAEDFFCQTDGGECMA
ncbi:phosphoadenosine phosphosulfate reductase domain-containing protein [Celeribacter naphthalenivorans]|uniref:phosphoadenosine phosphosulfate reductase domain-containing protein n=1 Tax=Celeribacter naphthalenivorans TaxID=1614694 RepID=UPI001CF9C93C|nr:phosphoadenosine phosphosulfate reductase family protein [Celeribacter naphthalenivorans]